MQINLLHHTPLWVASKAIRKCWASESKSDTINTNDDIGEADRALIDRVGNKNKHSSTLEHLNYTYDIEGISRAVLQELSRHRMASLSVKSTRYTLKELKETGRDDVAKFIVMGKNGMVNSRSCIQLLEIKCMLDLGISNDVVKYMLPESYKTSLVWTINARSLQNFLKLRTSKAALGEIRELAYNIYEALPEEHKYLFEGSINE